MSILIQKEKHLPLVPIIVYALVIGKPYITTQLKKKKKTWFHGGQK